MLNILQSCLNEYRRVVSADIYFVSVQACDELKKCGFGFIGLMKTATRDFCMEKMSEIELAQRSM